MTDDALPGAPSAKPCTCVPHPACQGQLRQRLLSIGGAELECKQCGCLFGPTGTYIRPTARLE